MSAPEQQATPEQPDLRQRIDATIRPRMLIGLQDAELYDEPGRERIGEWADSITSWVMAEVEPELAALRAQLADTQVENERLCEQLADTERRLTRAHERVTWAQADREQLRTDLDQLRQLIDKTVDQIASGDPDALTLLRRYAATPSAPTT